MFSAVVKHEFDAAYGYGKGLALFAVALPAFDNVWFHLGKIDFAESGKQRAIAAQHMQYRPAC
jgi:hypothetical protein